MVKSVLLYLAEHTHPACLVSGRIAGLREAAVLHSAAQPHWLAVNIYIPAAYRYVPYTEGYIERFTMMLYSASIEIGVKLTPSPYSIAQRHLMVLTVNDDGCLVTGYVGQYADYVLALRSQLYVTDYAVPVTLRLVGDAV